jgi:hypothetical protein
MPPRPEPGVYITGGLFWYWCRYCAYLRINCFVSSRLASEARRCCGSSSSSALMSVSEVSARSAGSGRVTACGVSGVVLMMR